MTIKKKFGSKGWTPERINSLEGKTYLITGASATSLIKTSGSLMLRAT